jgi:hypothetical protein
MRTDRLKKTTRNILIVIAGIILMSVIINAAQTGMFLMGQGALDCKDSLQCFTNSASTCVKAKANFTYYPQWPLPMEYLNDSLMNRVIKWSNTYIEVTNGTASNCTIYVGITVKASGSSPTNYNMTCIASGSEIASENFTYSILSHCKGTLVNNTDVKELMLGGKIFDVSEKIDDLKNQTDRIEDNQNQEKDAINSHIIS